MQKCELFGLIKLFLFYVTLLMFAMIALLFLKNVAFIASITRWHWYCTFACKLLTWIKICYPEFIFSCCCLLLFFFWFHNFVFLIPSSCFFYNFRFFPIPMGNKTFICKTIWTMAFGIISINSFHCHQVSMANKRQNVLIKQKTKNTKQLLITLQSILSFFSHTLYNKHPHTHIHKLKLTKVY